MTATTASTSALTSWVRLAVVVEAHASPQDNYGVMTPAMLSFAMPSHWCLRTRYVTGNDNDCDGAVDEAVEGCCQPGDVRQCGVALGVCRVGQQTCLDNNTFGRCIASVEPVVESCNESDDDCDGEVDEGVLNPCGGCGPVAKDQCNGFDDDCDGAIDEGVTNACGGCGLEPDEVCNGNDDDCDGRVDEGVVNACGVKT